MKRVMKNTLFTILTVVGAVTVSIFLYRLLFIRMVAYEIGGVKVPSEYSIITGKIKPMLDYGGKKELPVINAHDTDNIGLSDDQVTMARFRWAVFAQWAAMHSEYKGWDSDPEMFKKARDAFKKENAKGGMVVVK